MTRAPTPAAVRFPSVQSAWVKRNVGGGGHPWTGVGMSSNGQVIAAVSSDGSIWLSQNGGKNWTAAGAPSKNWNGVAVSSDGSHMIASFAGDGHTQGSAGVAVSTNAGGAWATPSLSSTNGLTGGGAVAISGDGQTMVYTDASYAQVFAAYGGGAFAVTTPALGGAANDIAMARNASMMAATWGGFLGGVVVGYTIGHSGEGTFLGLVTETAPAGSSPATASWSAQTIAPGYTWQAAPLPGAGKFAKGLLFNDPDNFYVQIGDVEGGVDGTLYFSFDHNNKIQSGASSFAGPDPRGTLIWIDPHDGGSVFANQFQVFKVFGGSTTSVWQVASPFSNYTGYSVDLPARTVTMTDVQTATATPLANAVKIDMTAGAVLSTTAILPGGWVWNSSTGIGGSLDGAVYAINGIPDSGRFANWPSSWSVTRFTQDGAQTWRTVVPMPPQFAVTTQFSASLVGGPLVTQWTVSLILKSDRGIENPNTSPWGDSSNTAITALDQKTGAVVLSYLLGPIYQSFFPTPSSPVPSAARMPLFNWYSGVA